MQGTTTARKAKIEKVGTVNIVHLTATSSQSHGVAKTHGGKLLTYQRAFLLMRKDPNLLGALKGQSFGLAVDGIDKKSGHYIADENGELVEKEGALLKDTIFVQNGKGPQVLTVSLDSDIENNPGEAGFYINSSRWPKDLVGEIVVYETYETEVKLPAPTSVQTLTVKGQTYEILRFETQGPDFIESMAIADSRKGREMLSHEEALVIISGREFIDAFSNALNQREMSYIRDKEAEKKSNAAYLSYVWGADDNLMLYIGQSNDWLHKRFFGVLVLKIEGQTTVSQSSRLLRS